MKYNLVKNKITFENGIEFTMSKDLISQFQLKKREEISKEEYSELVSASCREYSLYLIASRDYFSKDLFTKLYTRYRDSLVVKSIIEDYRELGYIDDFSLAKLWVENHKKYGKKKIEHHLYSKGIPSELIKELLIEEVESQLDEIERILERYSNREMEKNIVYLMRKGFEYSEIKKVINRRK